MFQQNNLKILTLFDKSQVFNFQFLLMSYKLSSSSIETRFKAESLQT